MTNQEILRQRWKKTDSELIAYYPKLKSRFKSLSDEILELYESLSLTRENLDKEVPSRVKRQFLKQVNKWKSAGLLTGYLEYLVSNITKYTYSTLFKILLFGSQVEIYSEIYEDTKVVLVNVANDCYKQGKKERPIHSPITIPDILDIAYIYKWLKVTSLNVTYEEYLQSLIMTATDELTKLLLDFANREATPTEEDIQRLLDKQRGRILNITEKVDEDGEIIPDTFTFSGVLETETKVVGNKAYIDPFPNTECRFIAEMDERTTKMCVSLNDQIFNTKDTNEFERYSDSAKGIVKYKVDGLIEGINLPPITDHFHWCRSTITYQVDVDSNEVRKQIYKK